MKHAFGIAGAAALALGISTVAAQAVGLTVNSITGVWTSTVPTAPDVSGQGTPSIRWGTPAVDGGSQSGYDFAPTGTPFSPNAETLFSFGQLTHQNWPIFAPSLVSAVFDLTVNATIDGGTAQNFSARYNFTHDETTNFPSSGNCAYGGANNQGVNINGCADRVTFALDVSAGFDTVEVDGTTYTFLLRNFQNPLGTNVNAFLTKENAASSAFLVGEFTAELPPIPLPAAAWLLLGGLGGLGLVARRRKPAA